MDKKNRYAYQEGIIGIVANLVLFGLKYWVGIVTGSLALIAFTVGGVMMVTSQGNEEQITKGKTLMETIAKMLRTKFVMLNPRLSFRKRITL